MKAAVFNADHNATAPVDPRVLERFLEVEASCGGGNPSSTHAAGRRARAELENCRRELAAALDVSPDAICFVSGGTEANNLVIAGAGPVDLPVLCGRHEHASSRAPAERRGVRWLDCDALGRARLEAPSEPVGLLLLSHAQSELGTLQPIAEAAELAAELKVPLHVDAAQTPGRHALDEVLAVADTAAFSAHKCGGLKGGSALLLPRESGGESRRALRPALLGGGQERGMRAGTPSVALAAATARALRLAIEEQPERERRARSNRDRFVDSLQSALREIPDPNHDTTLEVVSPLVGEASVLANTVMLRFGGLDGRLLLPALDLEGVAVSQGSACSSGSPEPPAVLTAIGLSAERARQCVRFSFAVNEHPGDEIDAAVQRVVAVVRRLRHVS